MNNSLTSQRKVIASHALTMDQSLSGLLDDINKSTESISNQYFKPPGIFHNAIVNHLTTDSVIDFTKILRDTKDREASMFKIDKPHHLVKRKDDKEGIFDYLYQRNLRNKRNRNLGIIDTKPIIQIPKRFYLEQQRLEISNSIEMESLRKFYNPNSMSQYSQLLSKFNNNNDAQKLLMSLFQGSIMIEDNIPMDVIINILQEIDSMWSGSEFTEKQNSLINQYNQLKEIKNNLEREIEGQESVLVERSANDIQQLINEKYKELKDLQTQIDDKIKNKSKE